MHWGNWKNIKWLEVFCFLFSYKSWPGLLCTSLGLVPQTLFAPQFLIMHLMIYSLVVPSVLREPLLKLNYLFIFFIYYIWATVKIPQTYLFAWTEMRENPQIHKFDNLKPANILHFCLISDSNHQSIMTSAVSNVLLMSYDDSWFLLAW